MLHFLKILYIPKNQIKQFFGSFPKEVPDSFVILTQFTLYNLNEVLYNDFRTEILIPYEGIIRYCDCHSNK